MFYFSINLRHAYTNKLVSNSGHVNEPAIVKGGQLSHAKTSRLQLKLDEQGLILET